MMFIVFNVIGLFIFLFLFWKKMKEDYLPNQIFSTYFYILFFLLISYFLSVKFLYSWWFWISLIGLSLGLILGLVKFKLKFFETFEAVILGAVICFSLYLLGDSVKNLNLVSFIGFAVGMCLVGFYQYIDMHYKNFSWYRSGKIGFPGLVLASLFFLLRGIVFIFYKNVLSFVPRYETFLSLICASIFFILTYNLSRSQS